MKNPQKPKMIKGYIQSYYFNIEKEKERVEYEMISRKVKNYGYKKWASACFNKEIAKTGEIEIDTENLFGNQFNTSSDSPTSRSRRLHFWVEGKVPNKNIRKGYYLEKNKELEDYIEEFYVCNFCGQGYHKSSVPKFCKSCMGSDFLSESDFSLLVPRKLGEPIEQISEKTHEEIKEVRIDVLRNELPEKMEESKRERTQKCLDECKETIKKAEYKKDVMLWLIENNVKTSNCIVYDYGNICFGWRSSILGTDEEPLLREQLKGFPYKYYIK